MTTKKPPQKRLRLNPTHRWSLKETDCLMNAIILELQEDAECFERPTARRFYDKIRYKNPLLAKLEWQIMKARFRLLQKKYHDLLLAKENGHDDEEMEQKKSDTFFDQMHEIFSLMNRSVDDGSSIKMEFGTIGKEEWQEDLESQASASPRTEEITLETTSTTNGTAPKRKQDSIAMLVAVQESRMRKDEELTRMKLEAEEKRWQEQFDLEREKNELKRLEIESNERIEMYKLKAEREERLARIEMEERVKRYELELKQANMLQDM